MESHHDGDETKGSFYLFVQDCVEAGEASKSICTAGPKDPVTVTSDGTTTGKDINCEAVAASDSDLLVDILQDSGLLSARLTTY